MIREIVNSLAYRLLDYIDGIHGRVSRRAWSTPGASAAESWIRSLAVSGASSSAIAGLSTASLTVQGGVVLSGPAVEAQWNSTPVRVARMRRIARRAGVDPKLGLKLAHYALLDNIVNRYSAEFSAYPYQPLRTMNLHPGDVFLDIGAFRGYVSVKAARKVGDGGRVYSLEPMPENFGFLAHHRDVNGLENITALCAAVTPGPETSTIEFFRTMNQGNAAIPDHLPGTVQTVQVANLGAKGLLDMVRAEMPNAKRVICSLTTNGTELAVTEALIKSYESAGMDCYFEIIIPVIFTESQARDFAERIRSEGWYTAVQYPWMRLWRSPEGG